MPLLKVIEATGPAIEPSGSQVIGSAQRETPARQCLIRAVQKDLMAAVLTWLFPASGSEGATVVAGRTD